jgi:hypothetical protein
MIGVSQNSEFLHKYMLRVDIIFKMAGGTMFFASRSKQIRYGKIWKVSPGAC